MENRITKLFRDKTSQILNIFITAGYPELDSLPYVLESLDQAGVDIIEIGMPYSDPLADGTTIQEVSKIALQNGLHLPILFEQIKKVRSKINAPLILMGYFNQVLQYGVDEFLEVCQEIGIDGLILPDLPMDYYKEHYQEKFNKHHLKIAFLITPETSEDRIKKADELSNAFIYQVASSSITGSAKDIDQNQLNYFNRISKMNLKSPRLLGFGIHDKHTFQQACQHANGAIIGSAFLRKINEVGLKGIQDYIKEIIS